MVRKVFFSFHFDNDVMRVQLVRNMGALEGNEPVSVNDWERVRKSEESIKSWIENTMRNCDCLIVLVGSETANRPWVKYEIVKAWNDGKGVFGIHIHNLNDIKKGRCAKGVNPFDYITFKDGTKLSTRVKCYDTSSTNAYNEIKDNIARLVEIAIADRKNN